MDQNPYVGPRSFEQDESQFFFGRDEEIQILSSLVMARRAVLFFAQSGAGKSSLLRAGLIPKLTKREAVGRGRRQRTYQKMEALSILSVGGAIPQQLAPSAVENIFVFSALYSLSPNSTPVTLAGLTLTDGLAPFFTNTARESDPDSNTTSAKVMRSDDTPHLLIFDQFEELFTKNPDHWQQREGFFRQVTDALNAYPILHVLFSMREDFIAELTPYAPLMPEMLRSRFRLERLKPKAALRAITAPAEAAGRTFDVGVAESLVENLSSLVASPETAIEAAERSYHTIASTSDAAAPNMGKPKLAVTGDGPGQYVEPVHLQIVCHQLWNSLPADDPIIHAKDVQDFGDVDQALTGFYEDTLQRVVHNTHVGERRLRNWFDSYLITAANTRGLVYRSEAETEGLPNEAVDVLNDAYIIRANIRGSDIWYELAHDRLVDPIWTANQAWKATYHNPVATALKAWHDGGQTPGFLLRGSELKRAKEFADTHPEDMLPEEVIFLETSTRFLNPLALATQDWLDSFRDDGKLLTGPQLEQARSFVRDKIADVTDEEKSFLNVSIRQAEIEQAILTQTARRRWLLAAISIAVIIMMGALLYRNNESRKEAILARNEASEAQAIAERERRSALEERDNAATAEAEARAAEAEARAQKSTAEAAQVIAVQERDRAAIEGVEAFIQIATVEAERDSAATLAANFQILAQPPTPTHTPTATPNTSSDAPADTPTVTPTPTLDTTATAAAETAQAGIAIAYAEQTAAAVKATADVEAADRTAIASSNQENFVQATQTAQAQLRATETAQARSVEMSFIPGGSFTMGSNSGDYSGVNADELPQRTVELQGYWIDRTEVTNAEYNRCIERGPCTKQAGGDINYQSNAQFDDYPVKFVSWDQANTYCGWLGKRLPTEAEWEKAARGTDGRLWPWGNSFDTQRANISESGQGRPWAVGSHPNGASPYGVRDMAGNVYEWTADWYKFDYYNGAPDLNPRGPSQTDSTNDRVIRGGSWIQDRNAARTADRNKIGAGPSFDIGFRCALTARES